ncbi:MAG: DUF6582 domain-containing protein [Acidobacteriaceae bacterium]
MKKSLIESPEHWAFSKSQPGMGFTPCRMSRPIVFVVDVRKDGKIMPEATWKPHEKHGQLTKQSDLPDSVYAFPKQRKEPMTDAQHVRNAVARFDQVIDVSDADRTLAFANIEKAASYYGVNLAETSWHDLGVHPQKK